MVLREEIYTWRFRLAWAWTKGQPTPRSFFTPKDTDGQLFILAGSMSRYRTDGTSESVKLTSIFTLD